MLPNWFVHFTQTLVSIPARIALVLFCNLKVEGLANLEGLGASRGVILASNHCNQLDSVALPCALPILSSLGPVYFVALEHKDYKRFPVGRYIYGTWIFRILGAYSIKRGLKNYAASLATHVRLLSSGKTVSIYPEGKIHYGEGMGEARGGVAYLAKETGAPIVPVAITGSKNATLLDLLTFRREIRVAFGHPTYSNYIDEPDQPEETRHHKAAQKVMYRIAELSVPLQ
ncbi:MAG TPA: lysophospholipid acyltransferase family protein [Candidatus Paceibacterota bacterium]